MNINEIIKKIKKNSFLIKLENLNSMKNDLIQLGLKKETSFFKLYSTYFSFEVGNGAELFTLEQLMKYNNLEDDNIVFASDDRGTFIYNKNTGKVFEYNSAFNVNTKFDLSSYENSWDSFESFLAFYYEQ